MGFSFVLHFLKNNKRIFVLSLIFFVIIGFSEVLISWFRAPVLLVKLPQKEYMGDTESFMRLIVTAEKMGWKILFSDCFGIKIISKFKNIFGIYVPAPEPDFEKKQRVFMDSVPENVSFFLVDWIIPKEVLKNREIYVNLVEKDCFHPKIKSILGTSYYWIDRSVKNEAINCNLKFLMTWYPTVGKTDYKPNPKYLMFSGDKHIANIRSEQEKYKALWGKLDKTTYFRMYGKERHWGNMNSYSGYVPADGKSFVHEINKNGICLVMHNAEHLKEWVPSGRIFEAAAAAAVIISDKHPFIEREFGDSVLYIDQNRDDMFEQVEAHMHWIRENPEEAKSKARKAHSIFLEKFTLEQQLEKLLKYIKSME